MTDHDLRDQCAIYPGETSNAILYLLDRRAELERHHAFAEKYRPQFAALAGMSKDAHWGDILVVLSTKVAK